MKKSLIILALLSGLVCAGRGTSAACETVHLGAALSLTGKYAINGALAKKAYEFTVDRINTDGGLQLAGQCHHIQLKLYDDESKADRGATLTERLINQDQVQFVLGPYSSALMAAIAPVTEKYKVPMVEGLGASRSLFNKGWQYLFAVVSTSEKYLAATIDLAAEIANASGKQASDVRLAIVVENDPFSLDVRAGIVEQAVKYGMEIIIDDKMPRDLTDLSSTLTKVKLLRPDLLLVSGHSKGAVTATRQLAEKDIHVPMVAMTQCESAGIIEKFGEAAECI